VQSLTGLVVSAVRVEVVAAPIEVSEPHRVV
jgi:hypothetical protein